MPKPMTPEEARRIEDWIRQVGDACGIDPSSVPVTDLLALAGAVSKSVARPAVPITGYLAGYAAALRSGTGSTPPAEPESVIREIIDLVPAPDPGESPSPH